MRAWIVALIVSLTALGAGTANAITAGTPDGNAHPAVGLVVFFDGDVYLGRCTGTLIAPTVLLTAAHCAGSDQGGPAPDHAQVWFDAGPIPFDPDYRAARIANGGAHVDCFAGVGGAPLYPGYPCGGGFRGTPHAHPAWTGAIDDVHDIGVVVLDDPVPGIEAMALPGANYLDSLVGSGPKPQLELELVGYGLQDVRPAVSEIRERRRATANLINLHSNQTADHYVQHSASPGLGGGACFGDSGGPVLHDGKVVAVFSFLHNKNCNGTGFSYRTDTAEAISFLAGFVTTGSETASAPATGADPGAGAGSHGKGHGKGGKKK